jgi:sugar/nucleoside kinase (ribokinase family)
MSEPKIDVLTIGNAIVDVLTNGDESFLQEHGITKGAMNLVDEERSAFLFNKIGQTIETSGGSAANTAAGINSLGGSAAFIGKVADDHLGKTFTHDIRAVGTHFDTPPLIGGSRTANCMIFITPDGERTMNTYLGACVELAPEDIDEEVVIQSQVTYFEGYLWDPPKAKEAILKASDIAHANDRQVAMSLSDSFCVDRYRDEFLDLIRSKKVDIVFANEAELKSLYQTEDFDTGLTALREDCTLSAVTRSEKGSVVVSREKTQSIDAAPIAKLVDSTGAGDLYAAGFLYGLTHGETLESCAQLGGIAAAEVIQAIGPRPMKKLSNVIAQAGYTVK